MTVCGSAQLWWAQDELNLRIRRVSKRIQWRVVATPEVGLLKTVPGTGDKIGLLIWAEIGTLERFPTSHDLCSYAGLVPITRSSGGKTTHGSLPHSGDPWLRWALVEATHESPIPHGSRPVFQRRLLGGSLRMRD